MMDRIGDILKRASFFLIVMVLVNGGLWPATPGEAAEQPLPESIHPALDYLLDINGSLGTNTVLPTKLATLVDFILQDKPADAQFIATSDDLLDPLVYHEFDVRQSLTKILRYAFHPVIPSHILALSSVRLAYWKEVDGQPGPFPKALSDRLANLQAPLVVHGVEHEEITPDLTSGAYYSYDLNRTLILVRVAGRLVFISLARQMDLSDVGRKGYVLGSDDAWNYLYSGEKGVNLLGLGWVETYMYDAFSALVFVQDNDGAPRVRCGAFKWLRAGWKDMNFVRTEHIRRGLERYADTFEEIIDAPELPPPSRIAEAVKSIDALSPTQMRDQARERLGKLEARYGEDDQFPRDWYEEAVVNGSYFKSLTRSQLEALLFLDYMKQALGRQSKSGQKVAQAANTSGGAVP
jgi:hypothetical protein